MNQSRRSTTTLNCPLIRGKFKTLTLPSGEIIAHSYGAPNSLTPGKLIGLTMNPSGYTTTANGSSLPTGGTPLVLNADYEPFGPNAGWDWGNSCDTTNAATNPASCSPTTTPKINQHFRQFDKDYRPIAIINDPEGYTRNIAWDQANRITGITVPTSGIGTIIPSLPNAQSVNQAFQYDNLDRLTSFIPGNPAATTAATGLALLPKETFTYDAIGNRTSRTTLAPGAPAGNAQTATYAYPNLSTTSGTKRHILNSISGANAWSYAYDASGNTIAEGSNVANAATTQFFSAYDAKNRLYKTQIGSNAADAVTYKINAFGQRVQKTGSGIYAFNAATASSFQFNARYMYDESGNLIGEYAPDGKLIAETVWFNGMPIATLRPKGSNSGTPLGIAGTGSATANNTGTNTAANPVNVDIYYLHPDHLGTPRAMTRSTAQAGATTGPNAVNKAVWMWNSDPFGTTAQTAAGGSNNSAPNKNPQLVTGTAAQIAAASFEQNLRMPGQVEDQETKKLYNYFRDYDSSIGRYTKSDPIGLEAGLSTFGYVLQRPIALRDPRGLLTQVCQYSIRGYSSLLHSSICIDGGCRGYGPEPDGSGAWIDNLPTDKAVFCSNYDPPKFCDKAKYESCIQEMIGAAGTPPVSDGTYSIFRRNCQQQQSRVTTRCFILACLTSK